MFLNEEDQLLLGSLITYIRASGESKKDWERRLDQVPQDFSARELIVKALDIVFRNEATA